jgi:hypothetical protein
MGYRRTEKGLHSGEGCEILSRQNTTKRKEARTFVGASERFYQTEDVRWNVFVAVDFEHPVTPRSASLVPGKRESALGAAKNRWQVARVPCTC